MEAYTKEAGSIAPERVSIAADDAGQGVALTYDLLHQGHYVRLCTGGRNEQHADAGGGVAASPCDLGQVRIGVLDQGGDTTRLCRVWTAVTHGFVQRHPVRRRHGEHIPTQPPDGTTDERHGQHTDHEHGSEFLVTLNEGEGFGGGRSVANLKDPCARLWSCRRSLQQDNTHLLVDVRGAGGCALANDLLGDEA